MADKLGVGTFRVERVIIPSTFILLETSEHKKLNNHRAKHRSRVRFLSRFCCDLACELHFVIVQPKALSNALEKSIYMRILNSGKSRQLSLKFGPRLIVFCLFISLQMLSSSSIRRLKEPLPT